MKMAEKEMAGEAKKQKGRKKDRNWDHTEKEERMT